MGEGRKKHPCVVASHMPPTGDRARNLGTCSDWESNQQPFGLQVSTQSTEPHQLRLPYIPQCLMFYLEIISNSLSCSKNLSELNIDTILVIKLLFLVLTGVAHLVGHCPVEQSVAKFDSQSQHTPRMWARSRRGTYKRQPINVSLSH